MTTSFREPTATARFSTTLQLPVSEGEVTLDAMNVPYGTARLTVPLTDPAMGDLIDPRRDQRVTITAGDAETGGTRTYNLHTRRRTISHHAPRTMEVELATDEGFLLDYAPIMDDTATRDLSSSLRAVTNYVLRTAVPPIRQNLAQNPWPVSGGYAGDWASRYSWPVTYDGNDAVSACPSTQDSNGRGFGIRGNVEAASPATGSPWDTMPVKAGVPITMSVYVTSSKTVGMYVSARLHDGAGNWLSPTAVGSTTTINATGARISVTITPAVDGYMVGTVRAVPGVTYVSGDTIKGRRMLIEPGTTDVGAYFDGNANPAGGTRYDGAANASTSRIVPVLSTTPSLDADISPVWSETNLALNPAFAVDTTNWDAAGGTSATLSRITGVTGAPRTTAGRVTWTSGTGFWQGRSHEFTVSAGQNYNVLASVRASTSREVRLYIGWYENGTFLGETFASATVGTTWQTLSRGGTAPARATHARVFIRNQANGASGQTVDFTGVKITEGFFFDPAYYDGATANTSVYAYRWRGTANASESERIALVDERTPDAFRWDAGTTAWTFLEPLILGTGLKLFCDENRVWRLINPAEYTAPGVLPLSPLSATEGTDTISRDDSDTWCTGVIVRYVSKDSDGVQRSKTDTAGVAGRIHQVEIARPYPGAGVAAWILLRRTGQGRQQDVTALSNWTATPAQQATISLPGTTPQVGAVEAITWGLSDGLMDVKTRALTDIVSGSINGLIGSINALTGSINGL